MGSDLPKFTWLGSNIGLNFYGSESSALHIIKHPTPSCHPSPRTPAVGRVRARLMIPASRFLDWSC